MMVEDSSPPRKRIYVNVTVTELKEGLSLRLMYIMCKRLLVVVERMEEQQQSHILDRMCGWLMKFMRDFWGTFSEFRNGGVSC